jgi:hypothetical protein
MNSTPLSAVVIRENPSQYLIRYGIEHDRFPQVLSSVTARSVLLLGVHWSEAQKAERCEPAYSLIAVIPLTASVDPDQTTVTFEGSDLVLRLVKSTDPKGEEALMPVTACATSCACEQHHPGLAEGC